MIPKEGLRLKRGPREVRGQRRYRTIDFSGINSFILIISYGLRLDADFMSEKWSTSRIEQGCNLIKAIFSKSNRYAEHYCLFI